jgi:hypothetical protein
MGIGLQEKRAEFLVAVSGGPIAADKEKLRGKPARE